MKLMRKSPLLSTRERKISKKIISINKLVIKPEMVKNKTQEAIIQEDLQHHQQKAERKTQALTLPPEYTIMIT